MGKGGFLLLILVLLIVGWDQYRMEQMRSDVRAITSRVQVPDKKADGASAGKSDLVTPLAEAEKHTRRAKELIRKKRTVEAQAELDKALASLKSANSVSTDIVGDAAEFMGKARDNAIDVFQKTWKDISEEAKNGKIGVEGENTKK